MYASRDRTIPRAQMVRPESTTTPLYLRRGKAANDLKYNVTL